MSKAKEGEDRGRYGSEKGDPEANKYPSDFVHVTNGGTKFKVGNEKDKEYFQFIHPMGSSVTVWPDGKFETFARGELRTYAKSGATTTVDGNSDSLISGHCRSAIGGGIHIEVTGDAGIIAGGDVSVAALGGSIGMQCKNFTLGTTGNFNLNVGGDTKIVTSGTTDMYSGGKFLQNAPQITLEADGVDLGAEGGELLHRKTDLDSDGDAAVGSATKVRAV